MEETTVPYRFESSHTCAWTDVSSQLDVSTAERMEMTNRVPGKDVVKSVIGTCQPIFAHPWL